MSGTVAAGVGVCPYLLQTFPEENAEEVLVETGSE